MTEDRPTFTLNGKPLALRFERFEVTFGGPKPGTYTDTRTGKTHIHAPLRKVSDGKGVLEDVHLPPDVAMYELVTGDARILWQGSELRMSITHSTPYAEEDGVTPGYASIGFLVDILKDKPQAIIPDAKQDIPDWENIRYQIALKLDDKLSMRERREAIQTVVDELYDRGYRIYKEVLEL